MAQDLARASEDPPELNRTEEEIYTAAMGYSETPKSIHP